MMVFFTNGVSSWVFGLISSFLKNRGLRGVMDTKSFQDYPVDIHSSYLVHFWV